MYADMWGRQWEGDINGPPYNMDWVEAPEFWKKMNDFMIIITITFIFLWRRFIEFLTKESCYQLTSFLLC